MLVTQAILGVAMALVGFAAWWLLRTRSLSSAQSIAVVAVAMWVTAMSVFWWRSEELRDQPEQSRGRSELVQSLNSLAWPDASTTASDDAAPPTAASSTAVQVASVDSLVGGLEARLAAQPNDAEGWALLAQSYAYTSNEEAVERAVQRAVALGVDEQALRERVMNTKRSAPAVDWVDRAIGARGP